MEEEAESASSKFSKELINCSCCCCWVTQSCPTLCDPVDCSPPGSSVPGILQARILEWAAIPFCRINCSTRTQTQSYSPYMDPNLHSIILPRGTKLSWARQWSWRNSKFYPFSVYVLCSSFKRAVAQLQTIRDWAKTVEKSSALRVFTWL